MPKLSIVTATYNAAATLNQTIDSILGQTYSDYEYIVIDGGSTDGTVDILKQYDGRVNWISEPDKGIYDAFNKGVMRATGEYIYFIGADDMLFERDTLEKAICHLDGNVDVLSGGIYAVDEKYAIEKFYSGVFANNKETYKGGMIPHPGMFVKKELVRKYMFDCNYKIAADYKFFLQCYLDKSVKFEFISQPVAFFSNGGTCNENFEKTVIEDISVEKEFNINNTRRNLSEAKWRRICKELLEKIRLLKFVNVYFRRWRPHKCNWETCRWCGRKS